MTTIMNRIPAHRAHVGCRVDGMIIASVRFEHRQTTGFAQRTIAHMITECGQTVTREVSFT